MDATEVRGTLHEMWETRPSRPRDDRKVAGVAAAIGRRYDVDPVLIRVGFVVAAFSGIGVPLYIAGWIVLPDGPADQRPLRRPAAMIGMVILAFLTFGAFFGGDPSDGFRGFGVFTGAVLAGGLLFLLHRSRGDRGPAVPAASGPGPEAVSLVKEVPPVQGTPLQGTPPSWDPLGAAPFAWDLPEPSAAPPPSAPPRRLPVTAVTLAAALLAGGATALLMLATGVLSPASIPILCGVVLAVLGLGLVTGSFLRAGHGLIPVALLTGLVTWGALAAPLAAWPSGGFGEFRVAPTTVAAVQPAYSESVGEFELDLRGLDLTAAGAPVRTSVQLGAGEVRVLVPADADVTFVGSAGVGEVVYGDQQRSGPDAALDVARDLGDDGVAAGRALDLTVHVNAGSVEVLRG
jgi:phage shock protein PspC (stress-responsive transcriptional regulator)